MLSSEDIIFGEFCWNKEKSDETFSCRSICFECIATLWESKSYQVTLSEDLRHSTSEEKRYFAEIKLDEYSILLVVFCHRNDRIRIISARRRSLKKGCDWKSEVVILCGELCSPPIATTTCPDNEGSELA